jgi:hypothetical protein
MCGISSSQEEDKVVVVFGLLGSLVVEEAVASWTELLLSLVVVCMWWKWVKVALVEWTRAQMVGTRIFPDQVCHRLWLLEGEEEVVRLPTEILEDLVVVLLVTFARHEVGEPARLGRVTVVVITCKWQTIMALEEAVEELVEPVHTVMVWTEFMETEDRGFQ